MKNMFDNDDLFDNKIIIENIKKLSTCISNLFGLTNLNIKMTNKNVQLLLFAIRMELFLLNTKNEGRDFEIYKKINKIFNYLMELKNYLKWDELEFSNILFDIFMKLKNFPYILKQMNFEFNELFKLKYEKYKVDNIWLVPDQIEIYNKIISENNFVLSVPTSFGKTFLIKKAIIKLLTESKVKNVVIIVPTNALISEYLNSLRKDIEKLDTKIVTELFQTISETSNLFIVTQEKMLGILAKNENLVLDWVIADEFYNVDITDIRDQILFIVINAIYTKNSSIKTTFLMPGIKNVKEAILFKLNREIAEKSVVFEKDESLTSRDIYFINTTKKIIYKTNLVDKEFEFLDIDNSNIFNENPDIISILKNDGNQNFLIYSPKNQIIKYAKNLSLLHTVPFSLNENLEMLLAYLLEYYGDKYEVIKYLEKGIGIHKKETDEFTRFILEKEFRRKNIRFLLCSPTLLKGVNLNTKYLFILTFKMPSDGNGNFPQIDARNLLGRIGRIDSHPHGFGFYINPKNPNNIKKASLENDKMISEIIDLDYFNNKYNNDKVIGAEDKKRINNLDVFIKKINIDRNIKFNTRYLESNKLLSNESELIELKDYFISKEITLELKEKINSIKEELKECIKLIFVDEKKFDLLIFLEWYSKIEKVSFMKKYRFNSETNDHKNIMRMYCSFLIEAIDYIYQEWSNKENRDDFKKMLIICLTDYVLDYSVKYMLKSKASYYSDYNSKNNEEKYVFKGDFFKKEIPDDMTKIFDENNSVHMTTLLENIMNVISTNIEYDIQKYISDLANRIFDKKELEIVEKKVEILSNNEKVIYLINLGVSRQIAIMISDDKYNDCYYNSNNEFYSKNVVIDNLINKLQTDIYWKRYISVYLKEKFRENE